MKKGAILTAIILVVIGLPFLIESSYWLGLLTMIAIYAFATIGLELLMGYGGQISLGNGGFIALGAYVTAILSNHGWNFFLILLMVILITMVVAVIVGFPILRLEGYYLAIATLGFALLIQALAIAMFSLTGGSSGISVMPLQIFSHVMIDVRDFYYLSWVFLIVGFIFAYNLIKTRVGRVLISIQSNEDAASALGIDTGKVKMKIFVLSAMYASLAGFLMANYLQFISPEMFGFTLSIELVVMSLLGGHGIVYGPILGAFVWAGIMESVHVLQDYRILISGLILIAILLFLPNGLFGLARTIIKKMKRSNTINSEKTYRVEKSPITEKSKSSEI
jgi:branched-chain amino acid transport system permease protein